MKTAIDGIYKGVREVKAGSFINEAGQTVNYNGCYKIIFDQIINNIPRETELKITKDLAVNLLPNYKPYDKIVINLDLTVLNSKNTAIKIVSIEKK